MPTLPEKEPPEWIKLSQALRYVMTGDKPVLEHLDRSNIVFFPNDYKMCLRLYNHLAYGDLKLYGAPGIESTVRSGKSSGPRVECDEFGEIAEVPVRLIVEAGPDGIDWQRNYLYRVSDYGPDDEDEGAVVIFHWLRLRVRWADLAKLPIGGELPDTVRRMGGHSSTGIEQDEFKADNEPISGARSPETTGQGSRALQGIIAGTKEAPAASDGGDVFLSQAHSQSYTTKLLTIVEALRQKIALDPGIWTRDAIQAESHRMANLSDRDATAIATILLRDSARDRGKTEK